jgi:S-adenosylmethionine hydrolase
MPRPIITLLTDFGLEDSYVAEMKGVILSIVPDAALVDITHLIPPQDVVRGALVLAAAFHQFSAGTVHLAVVDPGVGTQRRGIAVRAAGHAFVGPDNGLLQLALERARRLPAFQRLEAVHLDRPSFWLPDISPTFHGRDVFGPIAAHLARGVPLEEVGTPIESLTELAVPLAPTQAPDGAVMGQVIATDRFGNLTTNVRADLLRNVGAADVVIEVAGRRIKGLNRTYGDGQPGDLLALFGSAGYLEIAVVNGNAKRALGVGVGAEVTVRAGLRA